MYGGETYVYALVTYIRETEELKKDYTLNCDWKSLREEILNRIKAKQKNAKGIKN